jgi:hypothetical protein
MPAAESTGAQPPIEWLRLWFDHGGWFDNDQIGRFNIVQDLVFSAAMGLPGGGRHPTTHRLCRHFNTITLTDIEVDSLSLIYRTIFDRFVRGAKLENVQNLVDPVVAASIEMFQVVRKEFLPTPTKSHYTFVCLDYNHIASYRRRMFGIYQGYSKVLRLATLHTWLMTRVYGDFGNTNASEFFTTAWLTTGTANPFQKPILIYYSNLALTRRSPRESVSLLTS